MRNAPGHWAAVCRCGHVRVQMFRGSVEVDFARHLDNPERAPGAGDAPFPAGRPTS